MSCFFVQYFWDCFLNHCQYSSHFVYVEATLEFVLVYNVDDDDDDDGLEGQWWGLVLQVCVGGCGTMWCVVKWIWVGFVRCFFVQCSSLCITTRKGEPFITSPPMRLGKCYFPVKWLFYILTTSEMFWKSKKMCPYLKNWGDVLVLPCIDLIGGLCWALLYSWFNGMEFA